jgi:hypothetical protein
MINVIAGIAIGAVNEFFIFKLAASLIWGLVFVAYTNILRQEEAKKFISTAPVKNGKTNFGLSPKITFYIIEYLTSAITAFVFALLTGLVINLF